MFCSSCGATVADGTAFCGACGRPIVGYSIGQSSGGGAIAAAGAAPAAIASSTAYAGFWLRVVAAIIDSLILGIPLGAIFFAMIVSAIPFIQGAVNTQNPVAVMIAILPRIMFFLVIYLVASWLYWGLMESSTWQATLGKKALGLYVTDMAGSRASFGRTSGRFFAGRGISMVPSIGGLYFLVSCIMAGFTEKKQALHDMIASCLVMRNA